MVSKVWKKQNSKRSALRISASAFGALFLPDSHCPQQPANFFPLPHGHLVGFIELTLLRASMRSIQDSLPRL